MRQQLTAHLHEIEPPDNWLRAGLLLPLWPFFRPASWRGYVQRYFPELAPNFCYLDLSRQQLTSPALRPWLWGHLVWPVIVWILIGGFYGLIARFGLSFAPAEPTRALWISPTYTLAASILMSTFLSAPAGMGFGIFFGLLAGLPDAWAGIVVAPAIAGGVCGALINLVQPAYQPARFGAMHNAKSFLVSLAGIVTLIAVAHRLLTRWNIDSHALLLSAYFWYWIYALSLGGLLCCTYLLILQVRYPQALRRNFLTVLLLILCVGSLSSWAYFSRLVDVILRIISAGIAGSMLFSGLFILGYLPAEWAAGPRVGAVAGILTCTYIWMPLHDLILGEIPPFIFQWPGLLLILFLATCAFTFQFWRPILFYPLEVIWNRIVYFADARQKSGGTGWLYLNAAFWDELQFIPFGGLMDHLLLTAQYHPEAAQRAIPYLASSRQRWAARQVQIELMARRLENFKTIQAIAGVHREFLSTGQLADIDVPVSYRFKIISQNTQAALNYSTLNQQRNALGNVQQEVESFLRELTLSKTAEAGRFISVALQWQRILQETVIKMASDIELRQEIENPYIVAVPIGEDQEIFVGRQGIVRHIEHLLRDQHRPPLLLYGQRRTGKTSLLYNLNRLLPSSTISMFVDGEGIVGAKDYADLLFAFAQQTILSIQSGRSVECPQPCWGKFQERPFMSFLEWLDELEHALRHSGYHMALWTIDEFEAIISVVDKGRFDAEDVLRIFRHIIQHRHFFELLLASSHPLNHFQRWAGYLNNVHTVKISYLERDEALQLIRYPVNNFSLIYTPGAVDLILSLTRCHPQLIQTICYELVEIKNTQSVDKRRLAITADVELAAQSALENNAFFFMDIENLAGPDGCNLLIALANGEQNVSSSLAKIEQSYSPDLINQLIGLDILEQCEGRYVFQIELIQRWFAAKPIISGN